METSLEELVLKYAELNQLFLHVSCIELNEKLNFFFPLIWGYGILSCGSIRCGHRMIFIIVSFIIVKKKKLGYPSYPRIGQQVSK